MAKDGPASSKAAWGHLGTSPLLLSLLTLVATAALAGCGSGGPPEMRNWSQRDEPYTPTEGSSNAFDAYALIARNVEETVGEIKNDRGEPAALLNRVYFDVNLKREVLSKIEKHLGLLKAATAKSCEFRYTLVPIFTSEPYQRGWRLLGRALTWRIEMGCALGNFDQAISDTVVATKFGFDLTGGSATDASLGFEIADEARRAIAPHIAKLGAAQLSSLSDGLAKALSKRPTLDTTIKHEHARMLEGVQYVQDAYADGRFDELLKNMKEDVRDGVAYLRDLKGQDAKKRPAYFEGFAREAEEETRWLLSVAEMPAKDRADAPGPHFEAQRPWKSFAKQFFTAAEPLLRIHDNTLARTRLAILTCQILRQVKTTGGAPAKLPPLPGDLTIDPYTNRPFAYRASGPVFSIYSLGSDGIDNGGETDESFTSPDLTLEDR